MLLEEAELADEVELLASQLHDRCKYRDACDRAAWMHAEEEAHVWLRCHECDVYDRVLPWQKKA